MTVPFIHAKYGEAAPARSGLHHPSIAPYGAYQTGDEIRTLISIQNEREWQRLCSEVFCDDTFASHELFSTNNQRVANRKQLDQRINNILSGMTAADFRKKLGAARIAYGAINTTDDLLNHRALKTSTLNNSAGASLELPISPVAENKHINRRAPRCGEHSDAIRQEFTSRSN